MCGKVFGRFGGVGLCCVCESLVWVLGNKIVLCVGEYRFGFGGLSLCCVLESIERVLGSELVLCVGEYRAGLEE